MNGTLSSYSYLIAMSIQAGHYRMAKGRWATIAQGLLPEHNLEAIHKFTSSSNCGGQSICMLQRRHLCFANLFVDCKKPRILHRPIYVVQMSS